MISNLYNYLTVPGYGGSAEESWQTHWEQLYPEITRVEQDDWDYPEKSAWVKRLTECVEEKSDKPVILIAHSLGCGTIIHAINEGVLKNVAGLFLVGLPEIDREDFPKECIGFSPVPQIKLPIPAIMLASEDDEYCDYDVSEKWSRILDVKLVNVGTLGHMGDSAKLRDWEQGQEIFKEFINSLPTDF